LLLRNLQDYTGGEFVFADKSGQQTTTVQPAAGRVSAQKLRASFAGSFMHWLLSF
jgi:hypothetical protein